MQNDIELFKDIKVGTKIIIEERNFYKYSYYLSEVISVTKTRFTDSDQLQYLKKDGSGWGDRNRKAYEYNENTEVYMRWQRQKKNREIRRIIDSIKEGLVSLQSSLDYYSFEDLDATMTALLQVEATLKGIKVKRS